LWGSLQKREAYNIKKLKEIGKMEKKLFTKNIEMLEAIAANDNLENQSSHFVILNENMVPVITKIESSASYYNQKCPERVPNHINSRE